MKYFYTVLVSFLLLKNIKTDTNAEINRKDSAFDEIEYINSGSSLETVRPIAKHIVEGDVMTKDGDQAVHTDKRETIRDDLRVWRTRDVAYVITPEKESARSKIKAAMDEISGKSCVTFSERSVEENFLQFVKREGCWSYMGMQNGGQEISLGEGCDRKEIIEHEILHALGFFHEQSRRDRDSHININWENIKAEDRKNFQKAKGGVVSTLGVPYDLTSLMHFGNTAFGDGRVTIEAVKDPSMKLGNKIGLTKDDAEQLNMLYRCNSIPKTGYGPLKLWSECEFGVKRTYRLCYGKEECPPPNINGIQHTRMKCDESEQAAMKGCYNNKPVSLRYQEFATKDSCRVSFQRQTRNFVTASAFLECMKHAKRSGKKVFGITELCKCHYGDDDLDWNSNGESGDCGDGHSNSANAIYIYKILK